MVTVSCSVKNDIQAMKLYADACEMYSNGKFSETARMLNGVKFPPALILRGKALYFTGELDDAEKSCRQALKHRPGAFEAQLYLARILREKGEELQAGKIIKNLMTDNPNDARLLRFAANMALERGNVAEASVFLDRAAQLSSDGAMVLLDRARLHWIAGNGEQALEDLGRAKAMLPWDTPVKTSIKSLEKRITEAMQCPDASATGLY